MADDIKSEIEKLSQLAPEARARVAESLKAALEAELAGNATDLGRLAGKEFSRGIVFSRSRGALAQEDKNILGAMGGMDEATFGKFSSRLAELKKIKDSGGRPK